MKLLKISELQLIVGGENITHQSNLSFDEFMNIYFLPIPADAEWHCKITNMETGMSRIVDCHTYQ